MKPALTWMVPVLATQAALTQPASAETVKCRLGERIVYQEAPCPLGAASLPLTAPIPEPDIVEVDAARRRAEAAQAQLKAMEKEREAREKAEREAAEAAEAAAKQQRKQAKKQAKKCKAQKASADKKDAAKAKSTAKPTSKPQDECPE